MFQGSRIHFWGVESGAIPDRAISASSVYDSGRQCDSPLGMESGAIPDRAISASSAYDSGSVGAHHGRLDSVFTSKY
ncbi:hypothetical protein J6590_024340 [Homalodisca vitripennis]|nr:hypothetical protein J6590_024340 [Homalodisca vitripennis]